MFVFRRYRTFNCVKTALFLLAGVLTVCILIYIFLNPSNQSISLDSDFEPAIIIDRDVQVTLAHGQVETLALPERVFTKAPFKVEVDLSPYGNPQGKSLSLWVSYANLSCYVDGQRIYYYGASKVPFLESGGYCLHTIDLPDQMLDKRVIFEYEPLFKNITSYKIESISFGKRTNILVTHMVYQEAFSLLLIFMLFFIFLLTLFITLVDRIKEAHDHKLLDIGFLCLLTCLYFATQLWTVNYFFQAFHTAIYFVEYFSLMLISIPALNMLQGRLNPKFDRFLNGIIVISYLNFFTQCSLLIFRNIEFREMLSFSHLTMGLAILVSISSLFFTNGKKYPEKRKLIISMMPLWLGLTLSVISYRLKGRILFQDFLLLMTIIFVGIQIYHVIQKYKTLESEKIKSQIYMELALIDTLTGLKNRRAYQNLLEKIRGEATSFWILLMDLNHLKQINDTYGHWMGDKTLMRFAKVLKAVGRQYGSEDVFRIGGDEFMVFLFKKETFDMAKFIQEIRAASKEEVGSDERVNLSFAAGYHYYDGKAGQNLEEALKQADQRMYADKSFEKHKEGSGVLAND